VEGSNCEISENKMLGKLFGEKINAKESKCKSWEKEMFDKLSDEKINVEGSDCKSSVNKNNSS